jgi:hypothetical protein
VKSGSRLVVILLVIFVPVAAVALGSIASNLPRTKQLSSSFRECLNGCPTPLIWVTNVSGWSKITVQITPSSEEANCLRTVSGNATVGCTRYVEFSGDAVHWTIARVIGPQTVCYGGGLNCVCCLHNYIEFPVFEQLTVTFGVQGGYLAITGQNNTGVSVVASG